MGSLALFLHVLGSLSARRMRKELVALREEALTRPVMQALLVKISRELMNQARSHAITEQRLREIEIQHVEIAEMTEVTKPRNSNGATMPFELRWPKIEIRKEPGRTTIIPDGSPTPSEIDLSWPDEPPKNLDVAKSWGRQSKRK